jgi:hypothetical protein
MHLTANQENLGKKCPLSLPTKYLFSYLQVSLRHVKSYYMGLKDFIPALKSPSSSAEFEPLNLVSNGKHAKYQTAHGD